MAKWNAIPFYVGQKQLRQQLKDDTAAKWNAVPFCVFLEMAKMARGFRVPEGPLREYWHDE